MLKIGNIELPEFPLLLAPMEDVSDPPFRALCKEQGADVVYTEFISSEGLIRNAESKEKVREDVEDLVTNLVAKEDAQAGELYILAIQFE